MFRSCIISLARGHGKRTPRVCGCCIRLFRDRVVLLNKKKKIKEMVQKKKKKKKKEGIPIKRRTGKERCFLAEKKQSFENIKIWGFAAQRKQCFYNKKKKPNISPQKKNSATKQLVEL